MTGELRVGLIGYGSAGSVFHRPLVDATAGMRVTAVVTSRPVPDGVRRLASTEDLWQRAGDLDLVVVATPNSTHAPLAAAALDRGLHVVVDKPVALDPAQARRLGERAERAGRLLVPFHNRRWDADFRTVQRLVADGSLGAVHRVESRFERWRPQLKGTWRESDPAEGGLLLDLGTHLVDQALVLGGPVTSVYAEVASRRSDGGGSDDVFLTLAHRGGLRSQLWASALAGSPGPRWRVSGDRGAFVRQDLDGQEAQLRAAGRVGPDLGVEPAAVAGELHRGEEVLPVRGERGDWPAFYAGVAAAVRGSGPPPVSWADAVAGLEVLDAAARSARTGRVVPPEG